MSNQERNRCPNCGYEMEPEDIPPEADCRFYCPRCDYTTQPDELIGEWDDCAYDV